MEKETLHLQKRWIILFLLAQCIAQNVFNKDCKKNISLQFSSLWNLHLAMRKDPILYTSWLTFILQYCIKVCQMIKIELDYFQSCNSVTNLTAKQHNRWNTELEVLTKWLTYFGIRVQSAGVLSATVFGRTIHSSPSVFGSESVESRDLYKAGHQRLGLVVHPPHALLASCSHPP